MGTNLIGPDLKKEGPTATLPSSLVNNQMGFETDLQQRMLFKSPTNGSVYYNPQGVILAVSPGVGINTATPDSDCQIVGSLHATIMQWDHTLTGAAGSSLSTDSMDVTYEADIGGKLNLGVTNKDYSAVPAAVNLDMSGELTSVFLVTGARNTSDTAITIINGNIGDYCEIFNGTPYTITVHGVLWTVTLTTGQGCAARNADGSWYKYVV
jgi:hypothetical protein